MRKTVVAITAFALVGLGAAGCVSKSEYTKTVQAAQTRYDALDATNTRLKSELADAGKRNERLTADRQTPRAGGAEFLQRVDALKQRHGGGVKDFEPARLDFVPSDPFRRRKTEHE